MNTIEIFCFLETWADTLNQFSRDSYKCFDGIHHNVLGEEQAGFRSTYSTVDNLFCLQAIVTKYLRQKGGRLYAIFVDFEKAFDRIDRNILWNKLNSLNISSKNDKKVKTYLFGSKILCKI